MSGCSSLNIISPSSRVHSNHDGTVSVHEIAQLFASYEEKEHEVGVMRVELASRRERASAHASHALVPDLAASECVDQRTDAMPPPC